MPCWTVIRTELNLGTMDREIAKKAAESLGYRVHENGSGFVAYKNSATINYLDSNGINVSTTGSDKQTLKVGNELKRAYSAQAIQTAATRFGWLVKDVAPNGKTGAKLAYEATRRF